MMSPQQIVEALKSDPEAIASLQQALTHVKPVKEWQNVAQACKSLELDRGKLQRLIDAGVLKDALRDASDPLKSYRAIQVNVTKADEILRNRVA